MAYWTHRNTTHGCVRIRAASTSNSNYILLTTWIQKHSHLLPISHYGNRKLLVRMWKVYLYRYNINCIVFSNEKQTHTIEWRRKVSSSAIPDVCVCLLFNNFYSNTIFFDFCVVLSFPFSFVVSLFRCSHHLKLFLCGQFCVCCSSNRVDDIYIV